MTYKMAQGEDFSVITKEGGKVTVPAVANNPLFDPQAAYSVGALVYVGSDRYACISAVAVPAQGESNPLPSADSTHWSPSPVDMALQDEVEPLLFTQYYPDGSVKSAAEFTQGIKYNDPDTVNRTITVKLFCNTGTAANDNSSLTGRVVIPPFVDAQGNPYISDDGTRFKVVGVQGVIYNVPLFNTSLTAIVAPTTVTSIDGPAFAYCTSLVSESFPAVTNIGNSVFARCTSLASVSLSAAESIGRTAFYDCTSLAFVDFGATLSSVPTLDYDNAFDGVPKTCKIIVPDALYDAWIAATNWSTLYANGNGYKFLKHSEWEYARQYEINNKLNSTAAAPDFSASATYDVGKHCTYNGNLYECVVAKTVASETTPDHDIYDETTAPTNHWKVTDMTSPDATLDVTSAGSLRVVAADGTILWQQGYRLASESSPEVSNETFNLFVFASVPSFDVAGSYSVGDTVAYNGVAYTFTAYHAAGEWVGTDAAIALQSFSIPPVPSGKVGDFVLQIDNTANAAVSYKIDIAERAAMTISMLVPKGRDIDEMFTIAGGARSEFYLTKSSFAVGGKPTWKVERMDVEVA